MEFWMVWNPRGHAPTHRHSTEGLADIEARRLARKCPGQAFVVLKEMYAVCTAEPVPPVKRVDLDKLDEIPF